MFVRIRKESFGYILFERHSRAQRVVGVDPVLQQLPAEKLAACLNTAFGTQDLVIKWEFLKTAQSTLPLSAPFGMYVEIASSCTLNCVHCYKELLRPSRPISAESFKKLFNELREMGVFEIRFCGNEPTNSPHFTELSEFVLENDMFLGVNTNGFFGQDMQDVLIGVRPNLIVISIDGDEDSHDEIRGTGSYQKAVSLLRRLSGTNIKRRINTVLSVSTLTRLEHIVQLADANGADVSFIPLRAIGKPTVFKECNSLDMKTMHGAVQEIMRLRAKFPKTGLLTYFDILGKEALSYHSMDFNKPCPARKNGFISANGDFFPCDFLRYLGDAFYCGNVTESGFRHIWEESPTLKGFQDLRHDRCESCKHYMTKCYGGCISGSLAATGSPKDELCFVDILTP